MARRVSSRKGSRSIVEADVSDVPTATAIVAPDNEYGEPTEQYKTKGTGGRKNSNAKGLNTKLPPLLTANEQRRENGSTKTKHGPDSPLPHANTAHFDVHWPPALTKQIVATFSRPPNEDAGGSFLGTYKWPEGLKSTVYKSCRKIAFRFFIVDDSGSMILNDGKRIVTHGEQAKIVKCTRWSELSESMMFLAELSESLQVPSEFRLLNGSDPVVVGLGDDNGSSLEFLKEVMSESPAGPTPLCAHINEIVQCITMLEDELRVSNQKVAVVIATDGESSDGNVADALRPLTSLPVLVILRLCTEETQVVEYWNNIDKQLELDIDVLDDQLGDAKEVFQHNGWLTYGEPLHRMREFGASMKELDIIDESTISSEQMRLMCGYLFLGGNPKELPHPGVDWQAFSSKIKQLNGTVPPVFCPIHSTFKPWVDMKRLNRTYASESGSSATCTIM